MTIELKPCPFCGSDDAHLIRDQSIGGCQFVLCDNLTRHGCGARSRILSSSIPEEQLAQWWNRRAESREKPDPVKASNNMVVVPYYKGTEQSPKSAEEQLIDDIATGRIVVGETLDKTD